MRAIQLEFQWARRSAIHRSKKLADRTDPQDTHRRVQIHIIAGVGFANADLIRPVGVVANGHEKIEAGQRVENLGVDPVRL